MAQVLTCLQAAMRYEEGDGAGRSSRPQHSSSPQGQRLPVQRGPLEGPLPDASSLNQGEEIIVLLGAELSVETQPTQPQSSPYQVSSGPRSPGDGAQPPAPALWGLRSWPKGRGRVGPRSPGCLLAQASCHTHTQWGNFGFNMVRSRPGLGSSSWQGE